jgi:hypothetical protein
MLTEFGSTSDSKAAEIIVAAIAGLAAAKAADAAPAIGECKEGLFEIQFDSATGAIKGLRQIKLEVSYRSQKAGVRWS